MESVAFYQIMLELHEGRTDIDDLCLENNYKNDDFIFIQKTYEHLIFLEDNGKLPSIVPSNKPISLTDYIKQKIWFLSGPDAYFAALDDVENLTAVNSQNKVDIKFLTLDLQNLKKQIDNTETRYFKELSDMDKRFSENNIKFRVTFTVLVVAVAWLVGVYKK